MNSIFRKFTKWREQLDTFKSVSLISVVVFLLSGEINAEENNSVWFLGGGILTEDEELSDMGYDFHFGKEYFGNTKLILGYQKFGNSNSSFFGCNILDGTCNESLNLEELQSFYFRLRPHWVISENFSLYAEAGIHNYDMSRTRSEFEYTDMSRTTLINSSISEENASKLD